MKHFKKVLCILLVGSLLLVTACSQGNNSAENTSSQVGEGRYVETDITPPIDGRFASFSASDGSIVCFDEGLKTLYKSTDGGKSWIDTPGPGSNTDRYQFVQNGALLSDGRLMAYIHDEGIFIISPDGTSEPFPVADIDEAIAKGETAMVSIFQALENDRLLLSYTIGGVMMQTRSSGSVSEEGSSDTSGAAFESTLSGPESEQNSDEAVSEENTQKVSRSTARSASFEDMKNKTQLYDLTTGQVITELNDENLMAATSDNANMYLMDMNGSVSSYKLTDGSPSGKSKINFNKEQNLLSMGFMNINSGGSLITLDNKGVLYAVQDKSLLLADTSGNISTALESTSYSIGEPRSQINSVLVSDNGDIFINLLENGQKNRLYKYVWDENASTNAEKTLTVWSLEDNNIVRAAIAELRKKHPDATIKYEVALEGDNAVSAADAIKTLNTRLLNGSGPDVIMLDGCPVESYADKGMLLDLSSLLNTSDIYENLLSPYITDGKLYCLPTQFFMPALMGNADALAKVQSLDDLVSLVVAGNDTTADLGPGPGSDPFTEIPANERAELYFTDLEELCDVLWLSSAPSIVSNNQLNSEALRKYLEAVKAISDKYDLMKLNSSDGQGGGMMVSFSDGGTATTLSGSLVYYTTMKTNYGAFSAGNLQLLQMMMDREGSELMLFPGLTTGAWRPSGVAGISADTKVAEFAAQLLQTMISIEVQQFNYGSGIPITKAGIKAQAEAIKERLAETNRTSFNLNTDALIEKLQVPSINDKALSDMMWGTIEKCCKGEIDIEGAVKEIEQNVKNYLAERS